MVKKEINPPVKKGIKEYLVLILFGLCFILIIVAGINMLLQPIWYLFVTRKLFIHALMILFGGLTCNLLLTIYPQAFPRIFKEKIHNKIAITLLCVLIVIITSFIIIDFLLK